MMGADRHHRRTWSPRPSANHFPLISEPGNRLLSCSAGACRPSIPNMSSTSWYHTSGRCNYGIVERHAAIPIAELSTRMIQCPGKAMTDLDARNNATIADIWNAGAGRDHLPAGPPPGAELGHARRTSISRSSRKTSRTSSSSRSIDGRLEAFTEQRAGHATSSLAPPITAFFITKYGWPLARDAHPSPVGRTVRVQAGTWRTQQ